MNSLDPVRFCTSNFFVNVNLSSPRMWFQSHGSGSLLCYSSFYNCGEIVVGVREILQADLLKPRGRRVYILLFLSPHHSALNSATMFKRDTICFWKLEGYLWDN